MSIIYRWLNTFLNSDREYRFCRLLDRAIYRDDSAEWWLDLGGEG